MLEKFPKLIHIQININNLKKVDQIECKNKYRKLERMDLVHAIKYRKPLILFTV